MKILHLSDVHLGRAQYRLPEREEDYARAFEEALRLGKSADVVLTTGDLFDSRRPQWRTIVRLVEALESHGLEMYVIGGNHDFSYVRHRGEGSAYLADTVFGLLAKLKSLRLLCWDSADVGGVYIYGACATPREYLAEYRERLRKMPQGAVLAIHQNVAGLESRYAVEEDEYTMPPDVYRELPYLHIAAGHVHEHYARHRVGALWAGSLEIWDVGEFETWEYVGAWRKTSEIAAKGAVLLDVAGRAVSHKSMPVKPARPMYRLRAHVRDGKELEASVEEAVRLFDRAGAVVVFEVFGEVEKRPRQLAERFSRALYVNFVDKTAARELTTAVSGPAWGEVMRLMREQLGEHAEVVLRVMDLVREGQREAALRVMYKALYD